MAESIKKYIPHTGPFTGTQFLFADITSWTCKVSGKYRITAIGAGGQGAIATGTNGGAAGGGGGAGFCETEVYLYANDVLTLAIAPQIGQNITGNHDGTAGGNTSVICVARGLGMTAGGGAGGGWSTNGTAAGGAGGGAWGGAINSTGGAGGMAIMGAAISCLSAGGGAAGSPYGNGGSGGGASCSTAGSAAAGGGGIGGAGFSVGTHGHYGCGGGAGGPATGITTSWLTGPNKLGVQNHYTATYANPMFTADYIGGAFESLIDPWRALTAGGGGYNNQPYGGPGGGAAGGATGYRTAGILGGAGGRVSAGYLNMIGTQIGGGGGGITWLGVTGGPDCSGVGIVTIERIG